MSTKRWWAKPEKTSRIEIDAALKAKLKRRAVAEGVTLKDVMERAGWNYLAADRRSF